MKIPIMQKPNIAQRTADLRYFFSKMNWSANPTTTQKYINAVKIGVDQFQKAIKNPISNSSITPTHILPLLPIRRADYITANLLSQDATGGIASAQLHQHER
ncbi:MAG: hypothetical protein HFG24_04955 [Anaerotruncus sp.]|nr:hypothetical protein [Anaerotruncus sp.]